MRLRWMRASSVPVLDDVDLHLEKGLVGWVGGSARERRTIADLLLWSLGLPAVREGARAPWDGRPGPGSMEVGLDVGEVEMTLRDREIPVAGEPTEARRPEELVGLRPQELSLVWAGGPGAGPERLLAAGARIVARLRGLGSIETGLAGLGEEVRRPGEEGGAEELGPKERGRLEAELGDVASRLDALADVPERLRSLEAELRSLRADAAEVTGDMEAASMDWLRERQDAETHLQTYRDRARDLRSRIRDLEERGPEGPCPFCGRTLGEHHDEVMAELRDEWERLVQDGSWWRRRREQLELKPARLRDLESRSVRLQAAVEESAERLERCRFDLRERDELRSRRTELLEALGRRPEETASPGGAEAAEVAGEERRKVLATAFRNARTELLREEEEGLTRTAGTFLNRITGGRVLGIFPTPEGDVGLLEDGRLLPAPTEEDRAAAAVALRLALAVRLVDAGLPLGSILLDEPVRSMDPESRLRTVELVRGLLARLPQILVLAGDEVVDAVPEAFDRIVELRGSGAGEGSRLRVRPGGAGVLSLV